MRNDTYAYYEEDMTDNTQTPDLDFNHYYTPNGMKGSYVKTDGSRWDFEKFSVGEQYYLENYDIFAIRCLTDAILVNGVEKVWKGPAFSVP